MPILFDQPFQILLNLAREDKIDPWDVDINKVADLYVQKIREMENLDLRVSGRAISSASVLLRMKAKAPPGNGDSEEEDEMLEELDFDMPDVGPLTIIRKNPQQITLSDLAHSLQEVLEEPDEKERKKKKAKTAQKVIRQLDDYNINIEEHIQEFHEKIFLLTSNGEKINFTQLLPEKSKLEIARNLLLALFLSNRGMIALHQEEPFQDIYVELIEPPESENNEEDENDGN